MSIKPTILTLLGHYVPGFRAGGPIQSIEGIVHHLGSEYEFRIITSDHDHRETKPYSMVDPNRWIPVGKGLVYYVSSKLSQSLAILRLLRNTPYDVLYINSLFARAYSILPLWAWNLGVIRHVPLIIAPRGELAPYALKHNHMKKWIYVQALKVSGSHRRIIWQATSDYEGDDIRKNFGVKATVCVAQDIKAVTRSLASTMDVTTGHEPSPGKRQGYLAMVYLGRIHPHKNLSFALSLLKGLRGEVLFDIYGPLEDVDYWADCEKMIGKMSKDVVVRYQGELNHDDVQTRLSSYDILLLPSKSENFGHSIVESLLAGLPVVISVGTPWRNLRRFAAGWDIPLNQPGLFISTLQQLIDMGEEDFAPLRAGARRYANERCINLSGIQQNRTLISMALEKKEE